MPTNDQKNLQKKEQKKAFWFEATPIIHTRKKLSNGSEQTYYVISLPSWAIKRGEIDLNKKYRIELYPLEE